MPRRSRGKVLADPVLTISVFRDGGGFLARTEGVWTFEEKQDVWHPPGLDRSETAVGAAELALASVRRKAAHRKPGPIPRGRDVARMLTCKHTAPAK